eukprot:gene8381-10296_t
MYPGIVNSMDVPIKIGSIVSISLRGYKYPIALGETIQSFNDPSSKREGKAISIIHIIDDQLWNYGTKQLPLDFNDKSIQNENDNENIQLDNNQDNNNNISTTTDDTTTTTTTTTSITSTDSNNNEIKEISSKLKDDLIINQQQQQQQQHEEENINSDEEIDDDDDDDNNSRSIKKGIKDSELPLVLKTLFSKYMIHYAPSDRPEINMKKSSFKKVSEFCKQMEKKGLIQLKEPTPGNIQLVRIFRNHPEYISFKPVPIVGDNINSGSVSGGGDHHDQHEEQNEVFGSCINEFIPIQDINEVYLIPSPIKELFKELIPDQKKYLKYSEIQTLLLKYIVDHKLESVNAKSKIELDQFLGRLIKENSNQPIEKSQYFLKFKSTLKKSLEITRKDGSSQIIRDEIIEIYVKKLSNKFVIHVTNLESFGIPIQEFAQEGMKLFAASTTIEKFSNTKNILKIQGNDVDRVSQHIQNRYKIPKKFIKVEQPLNNRPKKK